MNDHSPITISSYALESLLPGGKLPELPTLLPVRLSFDRPFCADVGAAVRQSCEEHGLAAALKAGGRYGIACGSRGVANYAAAVAALADRIRQAGAQPLLIPAMGSHGGPTPEGQAEILAGYGVSEESIGAPVISSLEVTELGRLENGMPVYFSTDALALDGMLIVNRVKPHTDFTAPIESGLMKMCAVGLGKHAGAATMHGGSFAHLGKNILAAGRMILERANIIGGVALVENAYKETALAEYLPAAHLEQREAELLALARSLMPALPFAEADMLLVQRLGKDISGAGFDPNITGRRKLWGVDDLPRPRIKSMAVLELTEASHGNAAGIALADICSERLVRQADMASTYASLIAATAPQHAHIPLFFATDRQVIAAGLACAGFPEQPRLAWIEDTAHLEQLWLSPALATEMDDPKAEVVGIARDWPFDSADMLKWAWPTGY